MRSKSNFSVLPFDFKASFAISPSSDIIAPNTRHSGLAFRYQENQQSLQPRHSLSLTKEQTASTIFRDYKSRDNVSSTSLIHQEQPIRSTSIDVLRWADDPIYQSFSNTRKIKTKAQLDEEVLKLRSKISSVQRQDDIFIHSTPTITTTNKKKSQIQSANKNQVFSSTKENMNVKQESIQYQTQKGSQIYNNYDRIMCEIPKENRINNMSKAQRQNVQTSSSKASQKQNMTFSEKQNSQYSQIKGKENVNLRIGNDMIVIGGGEPSLNCFYSKSSTVTTPSDKCMKMSLVSSVKSSNSIELSKPKKKPQQNTSCCKCSTQKKMISSNGSNSSAQLGRNEMNESDVQNQCNICEKRRARRTTISENIDRRKLSEGQKQFLKKHQIGNSSKENSSYKKQRDIRQRSSSFFDSQIFEQPCRSASMAATTVTPSEYFLNDVLLDDRSFSVAPVANSISSKQIILLPETITPASDQKAIPKKPFTYSISFASTPENNQILKNDKEKWDKSYLQPQKEFTDQELGEMMIKGKQSISADRQSNEEQIQTQTTQIPGSSALGGSSLSSFGLLTSSLGGYSSLSSNIPNATSSQNTQGYQKLIYSYEERLREKEEQMTSTVKNYQQILASVTEECEKLKSEKEKARVQFEKQQEEERQSLFKLNEEIAKLREIEREKILLTHALDYKVIETDSLKEKIEKIQNELKDSQTQIIVKDKFIQEITKGKYDMISQNEANKIQQTLKTSLDTFLDKLHSLQISKLSQFAQQDDSKRVNLRLKSEESQKYLNVNANLSNISTGFTQRDEISQKSVVYEEEIQRLNQYIQELKLNEQKMFLQITSLESFLFQNPSSQVLLNNQEMRNENTQLLSARFQKDQQFVSIEKNKFYQDLNPDEELSLSHFASLNDPHFLSQDSSRQTLQLQQLVKLNQFLQKNVEEQALTLRETQNEVELLKQQNESLRCGIKEFEMEVEEMKQIFTEAFENERANIIQFYEARNSSERFSTAAMCLQSILSLTITQPTSAKKSQRISAQQSQQNSSIQHKSFKKDEPVEQFAFGKSHNDTFEETYEDQRNNQIGQLSMKINFESKRASVDAIKQNQTCTFEEYLNIHNNQQNAQEEIFLMKEKELQQQINSLEKKCERQDIINNHVETSCFQKSSDVLSQSIQYDFSHQKEQIASLQNQIQSLQAIKEQLAAFGKELNSKVNVQQLSDSAECLASLQEKQTLNYISQIELDRKIKQVQLQTNELVMELSTHFDRSRLHTN